MQKTRVFFVVSQPNKYEMLFETLEEAKDAVRNIDKNNFLIYVAMVENAYRKYGWFGHWNFRNRNDLNHVFTIDDFIS